MSFFDWLKQTFIIELEEEYAFKFGKNFIYPNDLVICTAIEKYAVQSGQEIKILSRNKPIQIIINEKDIYDVELNFSGYKTQCYSVKCKKAKT